MIRSYTNVRMGEMTFPKTQKSIDILFDFNYTI
jgi:hypothetical protein